jgi:hypothetical protein
MEPFRKYLTIVSNNCGVDGAGFQDEEIPSQTDPRRPGVQQRDSR